MVYEDEYISTVLFINFIIIQF